MTQKFPIDIQVSTEANVTPEQVTKIVRKLIDIGLADAAATIEDSGNSDEGDLEAAELATSLTISDPTLAIQPVVVTQIAGGVLTGITTNVPVRRISVDYDTEGCSTEELDKDPDGDECVLDNGVTTANPTMVAAYLALAGSVENAVSKDPLTTEVIEVVAGLHKALSRMIDTHNPDSIEAEWLAHSNELIRKLTGQDVRFLP